MWLTICIAILLVSYWEELLVFCSLEKNLQLQNNMRDDISLFWMGFKTKLLSHTALITQEQSASNLVQKFWRSKSMRKWLKDPPCPSFPNYLSSHGRYSPEKWRVVVRHSTFPFVCDLWCEKERRALACLFVWYQDGEQTLTREGFLLAWGKGQLWGLGRNNKDIKSEDGG